MNTKYLTILLLLGALRLDAAEPAEPALTNALLAAYAAPGATNTASALAELAALPEPGLAALAAGVVPSAQGGDTAVRTAVCELSYRATRPGQAKDRAKYGRVIAQALEAATDDEVRAFFIDQLRILRLEESVPALAARLASPALRDPAARALVAIGSRAAREALLPLLKSGDDATVLTALAALKEFPGLKAAPFAAWAAHTNLDVRLCALRALAATGDPAARPAFAAALKAPTAQERGAAVASYLDLARTAGDRTGLDICREVMRSGEEAGESQTFLAGLAVLQNLSPRGGRPDLVAALGHSNRVVRGSAILLARPLRDADIDAALAGLLAAPAADARADGLAALAARGALDARTARGLLDDADADLRLAAARHLLRLAGAGATADLLPRLAGPDAVAVCELLTSGLPGAGLPALAAALPAAVPETQARLLDILGARRAAGAWDAVAALAGGTNDAVARAAIKTLGLLADAGRLPGLLDFFIAAPDARATDAARAVALALEDKSLVDAALAADARIPAARRAAWHNILRKTAGAKALAIVTADAAAADAAVRRSAIKALTQWEGDEAKPVLQKLATDSADPEVRAAAAAAAKAPTPTAPAPKTPAPKPAKPAAAPVKAGDNLAAGQPVKASVPAQGPQAPERAVDGDETIESSWWGAHWPADLTVDLGEARELEGARIVFWYNDGRHYGYALSLSVDGTAWTEVADRRGNTEPVSAAGTILKFAVQKARYARLTVSTNSANEAVHVVEFQLFAPGKVPAVAVATPAAAQVKPAAAAPAAPAIVDVPPPLGPPDAEGFVPLFNGKDLTGWIGSTNGYGAADGVLFCDTAKGGGNLFTAQAFSDFVLRFDFRLPAGANNGLGIRSGRQGDSAYAAMELQILDDTAPQYATLQPYQYHGSIYGVVPAKRGHQKPIGEWNTQEVRAVGGKIAIVLNGTTIVDADLDAITETADHKSHPGLHRTTGHIGWLGHGSRVEFRNVRIKEILNAPPAGFTPLFNGRDLDGWKGLVANPLVRAKLPPDELKTKQAAADQRMREHWRVEDGVLVFDGKGDALCTAKDYGDFEMFVDWKIGPGGDSGIYLRGSPQVQIWDPVKNPVGSGGLYNNKLNPDKPLVCADRAVGQWNTFFIRMVGDKVTVKLNETLVVDQVVMENYWDRAQPIFPTGQLELQNHGAPLYFRNIHVRELPR